LGGNASGEIRVYCDCAGEAKHPIVKVLRGWFMNRDANIALSDKNRMRMVEDEKNIDLRVLTRAFGVEKNADGTIAAVKALDLRGNRVVRFVSPLFCDATGDGWVGYCAGADWRMGREERKSWNTYDHVGRFWIPYRSIYSRNVGNLFVVGRCFSCSHVGLGAPRVISTLSQLGVAAGEAAA